MTFRRLLLFGPALALLAGLPACSSKEEAPAPAPPSSTMSWSVDGRSETASSFTGDVAASGRLGIEGGASFSSGYSSQNIVWLRLPNREGTFAIPGPAEATYRFINTAAMGREDRYEATAGTVTVSSYTAAPALGASQVVGTFTFTGRMSGSTASPVSVTGQFNVRF